MTRQDDTSKAAGQSREERLKAALKANLARRKAQNRKRKTPPATPEKTGQDEKG